MVKVFVLLSPFAILSLCMEKLRSFHSMKIRVQHTFDIFKQIEFYEALWDGDLSVYRDYQKTKANVYHSPARNVLSNHRTEVLLNAKCPVLMVQKPDIESLFKLF